MGLEDLAASLDSEGTGVGLMDKLNTLKRKIATREHKRNLLDAEITALKTAMVTKCEHPQDSIRRQWESGHGAPWLICLSCGYAEEGWGIGYWKLQDKQHVLDYPSIPWREFSDRRTVFRTQRQIVHEKIHVESHKEPEDMFQCNGCKREREWVSNW